MHSRVNFKHILPAYSTSYKPRFIQEGKLRFIQRLRVNQVLSLLLASFLLDGGAIISVLVVDFQKLGDIHLGLLDQLGLVDMKSVLHIQGEDAVGSVLDGELDLVGDQSLDAVLHRTLSDLLLHDLDHALTDAADLGELLGIVF
jgi:hypothetical protein